MIAMRLAALALGLVLAFAVDAKSFRWSSQGDYLSADPHARNEGINNLLNDEIYERLTSRAKDLSIIPALATSWEAKGPTLWRFNLRRGVVFHDGTPFTADDVVFSLERAQMPSSNFKVFATPLGRARKVDDYTVEFDTAAPTPAGVFLENLNTLRIMSRAWCEKNRVLRPQDFKTGEETFASRAANGTGPFSLAKREADVATVLRKNPKWWGLAEKRFEGNIDEIVYRPVKSDATRMAALLTGELDPNSTPQMSRDLAAAAPHAEAWIIADHRHMVNMTAPDAVNEALRHWLTRKV